MIELHTMKEKLLIYLMNIFVNIGPPLAAQIQPNLTDLPIKREISANTLFLNPVSPEEVARVIGSLKRKDNHTRDKLTNTLFINCKSTISKHS